MNTTLVIGASFNPNRYSNLVINKLLGYGVKVYAIGDRLGEINGVEVHAKQIPLIDVDTVALYLNPKKQEAYYDYIISLKPQRVIFNPGTENPEFYRLLKQHDIYFEESCALVLLSTNQY